MKKLSILVLFMLWLVPAAGLAAAPPSLTVVYYQQPEQPLLSQVAFSIWQNTALLMGTPFKTITTTDWQQALLLLHTHKASVIVGAIKPTQQLITAQDDYLDSYIPNQIGIVVSTANHLSIWDKVFYLLKTFVGISFITALGLMLIFAVIVWLVEITHGSTVFPRNPIKGIACAWWFSIVSFTSVGYGDYIPKSALGRAVTALWLFLSLILGSTLFATMNSQLSNLENASFGIAALTEVSGKPIGYFQDHTEAYNDIEDHHGIPIAVANFQVLSNYLSTQKISAAFVNSLVLNHELRQAPSSALRLTDLIIDHGTFSFIIQRNDPLESQLVRALYQQKLNGRISQIISTAINTV